MTLACDNKLPDIAGGCSDSNANADSANQISIGPQLPHYNCNYNHISDSPISDRPVTNLHLGLTPTGPGYW